MRKIYLFMVLSLDGFVCRENDELDWEVHDDEMSKFFIPKFLDNVDTMLMGRVLYDGFEQAWPAMAKDPNSAPEIVEFANWVEDTPKIVFSDSPREVTWKNSQVVNVKTDQDVADEVSKLKQTDGKGFVVFGGAQFAQTLVKFGLVDEYQFKLQPIALGKGKPLFGKIGDRAKLKLIEAKSFDSGVVTLRYLPA